MNKKLLTALKTLTSFFASVLILASISKINDNLQHGLYKDGLIYTIPMALGVLILHEAVNTENEE